MGHSFKELNITARGIAEQLALHIHATCILLKAD